MNNTSYFFLIKNGLLEDNGYKEDRQEGKSYELLV